MSFTTNAFLEALSLPEEHPYLLNESSESVELKPWSFIDYFGSVSLSRARASIDDCPNNNLSPFWRDQQAADCDASMAGLGNYNKASNVDKIGFFEEIKPCLASMCQMTVLLWAPIILILCAKRLMTPHRHHHSESKVESVTNKCGSSSSSSSKDIAYSKVGLSSSMLRKNPLVSVSCVGNKHKKAYVTKLCNPITQHQSSTISIENCNSCTGTGDPLAYIIALLVSAIIMTDAMYVLEFSQSVLVIIHTLIILMGMKRLGCKAALLVALPITCKSFNTMQNQDLDLPTTRPGIYYSEANPIISNAINNYWPLESYTYEGKGTPWMITGDIRTGLPFLLYSPPGVQYIRRYVR